MATLQPDINPPSRSASPLPQSTDDRATTSYVRRTLCSHHAISSGPPRSIHELLPPLTTSNDLDLQLYAIIAIVLKEFVQSWYGKMTPDPTFVDEILRVIAHCTRALEERLRDVDMEALVLDEIPTLVEAHITAYRTSHASHPLPNEPREIYHSLHPHPALSPVPDDVDSAEDQAFHEQAWRQMLSQNMLAVLLPTDDLQNPSLRSLVQQILAEMIIGNVLSTRLTEPWALYELIINISKSKPEPQPKTAPNKGRLQQLGLLSKPDHPVETKDSAKGTWEFWISTFWIILNYGLIILTFGRNMVLLLLSSANLPFRPEDKQPILAMPIWALTGHAIEVPKRMPWLAGILGLLQWSSTGAGAFATLNGRIDRLLSNLFARHVLTPSRLPSLLRTVRRTLFPANTFPRGPKRVAPDAAETEALRLRAAESILNAIPPSVRRIYLASATNEDQLAAVEGWLSVLSDAYCNKHLLFAILELVIVRLMPEMQSKGPVEMMEERLGVVA